MLSSGTINLRPVPIRFVPWPMIILSVYQYSIKAREEALNIELDLPEIWKKKLLHYILTTVKSISYNNTKSQHMW